MTRIAPYVPVALVTRARRTTIDEPCMLVRRMVRHEIEDDFDTLDMRSFEQRIEIRQRSKQRVDVGVVCYIVSEIRHGRGEDGRYPDGIHSEFDEIGQSPNDTAQIANAVAVCILKRARVDLIDDACLPPACRLHASGPPLTTSTPSHSS
jgi:hypothetical protein